MPTLPRGSISGPPAADDEHTSSALQAGPQADAAAAAAAAAATPAVAAAPYVTSRMEAEAAAQGRPIPTLCCPGCGKTRKVELIPQQTGAPKIKYISGPTYISTDRDKVQKCSCKECGIFRLEPPPDDGAASAASSAVASPVAAASAVASAAQAFAAEQEIEQLSVEAELFSRLSEGDAAAAAPYVTSKMEAEAAAQGRPIPMLCCPDCGKTRKVELIPQQTGAPKIRYISGPTYVSTNRNKVQKCSCKECGVFFLEPPPDGGQQEDECGGRQLTDDGAGVGAGVGVALTAAAPAAAANVEMPDAKMLNVNNGGGAGTVGAAAGDGAGESAGVSTTEDVEMRNVESSRASFVRPFALPPLYRRVSPSPAAGTTNGPGAGGPAARRSKRHVVAEHRAAGRLPRFGEQLAVGAPQADGTFTVTPTFQDDMDANDGGGGGTGGGGTGAGTGDGASGTVGGGTGAGAGDGAEPSAAAPPGAAISGPSRRRSKRHVVAEHRAAGRLPRFGEQLAVGAPQADGTFTVTPTFQDDMDANDGGGGGTGGGGTGAGTGDGASGTVGGGTGAGAGDGAEPSAAAPPGAAISGPSRSGAATPVLDGPPQDVEALGVNPVLAFQNADGKAKARRRDGTSQEDAREVDEVDPSDEAPRRRATRQRTETGTDALVKQFKSSFPSQVYSLLGFQGSKGGGGGPDVDEAFPIVSGGEGPTASVTLNDHIACAGGDPNLASVMLTITAVAYQPVRSHTLTLSHSPLDAYLPPTSCFAARPARAPSRSRRGGRTIKLWM